MSFIRIFLIILLNVIKVCVTIGGDVNYSINYVNNWPSSKVLFGQLSAVSVDAYGNVYVFHRGKHVWDFTTFALNNTYLKINEGPIQVDTVVILNKTTGDYIKTWGRGLFYMPHGLTVDHENNVWLTDVALHQVFKYDQNGKHYFTLGEKFMTGNDNEHFCKPTSVAVISNGDFFVADGYCNSRIIKFSATGSFLSKWGAPNFQSIVLEKQPHYSFNIPHSLTLIENLKQICVADRENGRILCFNYLTGKFVNEYKFYNTIGHRLFSITYTTADGGLLYAVNGPPLNTFSNISVGGFVIRINKNSIVNYFEPNKAKFFNPHDIAIDQNGSDLYVVELYPYKIHKFHVTKINNNETTNTERQFHPVYRNKHVLMAVSIIVLFLIVVILIFIYKFCYQDRKRYKSLSPFSQFHNSNSENNALTQLM